MKGQENPGVTARRSIKETAFPKKMCQCQIWMFCSLKYLPRAFCKQWIGKTPGRKAEEQTHTGVDPPFAFAYWRTHWKCIFLLCRLPSFKLPYLRTHTKTVFIASASIFSPTFMDSSAWLLNKNWVWIVETSVIPQLIFPPLVALLVVYRESNLDGLIPGPSQVIRGCSDEVKAMWPNQPATRRQKGNGKCYLKPLDLYPGSTLPVSLRGWVSTSAFALTPLNLKSSHALFRFLWCQL